MEIAAEPRPAQLPLRGGRAGAVVKVHPLLTGELLCPPVLFERPGGPLATQRGFASTLGRRKDWSWVPVPAFLIEHPSAGPVLVDTGLHQSVATDIAENFGRLGKLLFTARMEHDQALTVQLPKLGIEPPDVHVVVMTHLHNDHASAVVDFPNATFVVDGREWEAATGPRPFLAGYVPRQFDHAFDWRTLDFDGPEVGSFSGFARTIDLFGDGSVRLASTPGHTPGHMSVVCRTAAREVLLVADAAYTERALKGEHRPPLILPDEHLYRRSLREIRRYIEETPSAVAIPGHDADAWARLDPVY